MHWRSVFTNQNHKNLGLSRNNDHNRNTSNSSYVLIVQSLSLSSSLSFSLCASLTPCDFVLNFFFCLLSPSSSPPPPPPLSSYCWCCCYCCCWCCCCCQYVSLYSSFLRISAIACESAVPFIPSPLNDIYSDTHFIFYLSHWMTFKEVVDTRIECAHIASSRLYFTFPVCVQSNLKHISLFYIYRIHIFHMNMWYDISKKKKKKKQKCKGKNLSPSVYS